jgi:hypothetical protein
MKPLIKHKINLPSHTLEQIQLMKGGGLNG